MTSKTSRSSRAKPEFIISSRYGNTLPDVPFDPKLLKYETDMQCFIPYQQTSIEKEYKYELHTDVHLGIRLDLVQPEQYKATADEGASVSRLGLHQPSSASNTQLHPDDARLMIDDVNEGSLAEQRMLARRRAVPWLRKSEFLVLDPSMQGPEIVKRRTSKQIEEEIMKEKYSRRPKEVVIDAIEQTFQAMESRLTEHPLPAKRKKGVKPVAEMPILPDSDLWQYLCTQVIFDVDPTPDVPQQNDSEDTGPVGARKREARQRKKVKHGLLMGMRDANGANFVAYFAPTDSTVDKLEEDEGEGVPFAPEQPCDFEQLREYNWQVRTRDDEEKVDEVLALRCVPAENVPDCGFEFDAADERRQCVVFNELSTTVRLRKRKTAGEVEPVRRAGPASYMDVQFRRFTKDEVRAQKSRLQALDPDIDVDDIDESQCEPTVGEASPVVDDFADIGDDAGEEKPTDQGESTLEGDGESPVPDEYNSD